MSARPSFKSVADPFHPPRLIHGRAHTLKLFAAALVRARRPSTSLGADPAAANVGGEVPVTDPTRPHSIGRPVEPPGGGRQDHDVMRIAAMHSIHGPASTDTLAASGGLDVPGGEPHPELASGRLPGSAQGGDAPGPAPRREPIPGERDPGNLTHREPGAVSGQFAGADIPPPGPHAALGERTARDRTGEGGGAAAVDDPTTATGKKGKKRAATR
jgi:hypothetical protein